jgi:very-short-patch-repair endonuclease
MIPIELEYSRRLRLKQTPSEKVVWELLRNRRYKNKKFLRQHVIRISEEHFNPKFFIADFYCAEHKLIIELDGMIHQYSIPYDTERDHILEQLGYHIIRFTNELIFESPSTFLEKIDQYLIGV